MTERVQVSSVQLRSWRGTGYPYKLIAAAIAEWAVDKERGTVLPDDAEFGRGLDRVVGPKPFLRAKHLLERHGVLEINDGPFYVALKDSPSRFPGGWAAAPSWKFWASAGSRTVTPVTR